MPPPGDSDYKPHMVVVWVGRALLFYILVAFVACSMAGCAGPGAVVEGVNQLVNASMAYQKDEADQWRTDCPPKGDCEDYALCKARHLLAQGYKPSQLALWVMDAPSGPHAVLVVDNQYTLDNQVGFVWQWPTQGHMYYGCRLDGVTLVPMQDGKVLEVRRTSNKCKLVAGLGAVA